MSLAIVEISQVAAETIAYSDVKEAVSVQIT